MSDDVINEFVDTHVLVYAYDRTAGQKHEQARELVDRLWESGKGCLSIQVLQEFYVTVTRKTPVPLRPQVASQLIEDLSHWNIHSPKAHDVLRAIELQQRYTISFWDAMILRGALSLRCETVWSEDLNPGQLYENTRVCNPFQSAR